MKNFLRLEEFLLFCLAFFLFSGLDYGWGASRYALLFLTPDLPAKSAGIRMSMLGYLANPRLGAWILRHSLRSQGGAYNLIHHKGLAVALYVFGYLLSIPWLMFVAPRVTRSFQPRPRFRLRFEMPRSVSA